MRTRPRLLTGLAGAAIASLAVSAIAAPTPAPATAVQPHHRQQPRPNIVFVLADDLGWSDVSTGRSNLGNPSDFKETPTIERLAQEGAVFDNAYACINCAPTRAALLTGQYAPRPTNNIYAVGDLNRGGDDTLLEGPPEGLPDGKVALPDEAVTVGETLQGAATRRGTSASSTSPGARTTSRRSTGSTRTSAAARPATPRRTTPRTDSSTTRSRRAWTRSRPTTRPTTCSRTSRRTPRA